MDVESLGGVLRQFRLFPDPRGHNATYTLPQLLTLTLMACLRGCDDYDSIAG